MRLVVLDGGSSIGGTKILAESRGEAVLLDFGLSFSRYQLFFEEFMRPRSVRGLTDLRRFGLIPDLTGAYREDLQIGEPNPSASGTPEIVGLLLTHAHVDHFGVMGVLRPDIPVHCTSTTMAILKASQDAGKPDFWSESAYVVPKVSGDRPGVIKSAGTSANAIGRPFVSLSAVTSELAEFMSSTASESSRSRKLAPGSFVGSDGRAGRFRYRHWPVDHSVLGGCSFEIDDGDKRVIYSGDLRFHGLKGRDSRDMVEAVALNPPDILIVEGTRLGRKPGPVVTESCVAETAYDIVVASQGRLVIADFGARHVERLSAFLSIAKSCGRRLVLTTKDILLLEALWAAGEKLVDPNDNHLLVYDEPRAVNQGWEQAVCERHAKKLASAKVIRAHPESCIVAFSFFDLGELIDIGVSDGVYIYSSSEAYTEDQRLDLHRLSNWIREFRFDLHGFRWEGGPTGRAVFDAPLNASGHLSEADLTWLLETIRAKAILPVHTEHPKWFEEVGARIGSRVLTPAAGGEVSMTA
jgi:ribonuclease J